MSYNNRMNFGSCTVTWGLNGMCLSNQGSRKKKKEKKNILKFLETNENGKIVEENNH